MATSSDSYPASLDIDYVKKHSRLKTLFRFFLSIPILIIVSVLSDSSTYIYVSDTGEAIVKNTGGIAGALFAATLLMIVFRKRYPKWWFDFNLELNRFMTRVGAYMFLLTDVYPSTEDQQAVHLELNYPDAKKELGRLKPLFKWILALPHYIMLAILVFGAVWATIVAWFSIMLTGTYPKALFDYVVGVGRWALRVNAYTTLLTTDKYPPFTLK